MSVSGILSSSFLQNQLSSASNPYQKDMEKLSQDLQSGNLSAAQSDFATLQKAFAPASASTSATSTSTNTVAQAFNQLSSDLQSGNLSAAQKDYSTLQQDLQGQSATSSHLAHNHHRIASPGLGVDSNSGNSDSSSPNSLLQDLNQLGQSLTSGNLTGAQQAYATLEQQLQQFALGSANLTSGSLLVQSPVSVEA
ncbi:MAG: hypothetical protein WBW53_14210 [Terriglobales bacterium]